MNIKFARSVLIPVAFLLISGSIFAHHGTNVSYDSNSRITLKGTVTEFRYTNPHVQLYFDVKNDKGEITHWSAEGIDPANFIQWGWGKKKTLEALAPGTEITITLSPSRNGKPVGLMNNIILPNGDAVCGLPQGRTAKNCKPLDPQQQAPEQ